MRTRIGVVGAGNVSPFYLETFGRFDFLDVAGVADVDAERAQKLAARFGVPRTYAVEELLGDAGIELVVNLTPPVAHATVGLAALEAGRSVYNEKPLAIDRDGGRRLLEVAAERGQRVGGAPETFLGGPMQTARALIDGGAIGEPVAAAAFTTRAGPESWHPSPVFFYQRGAGPLFDLGVYHLTVLVTLLGPLGRVSAVASKSERLRTVGAGPLAGSTFRPETPTHVSATLEFEAGPVGTLMTSWDAGASRLPPIEIYGSDGTLSLPDPTVFGGVVRLRRPGDTDWREVPTRHGYVENSRGLGAAEMVAGMREGRRHRASGELAFHVLDVMESLYESSEGGRHLEVASTCERPEPLPEAWP